MRIVFRPFIGCRFFVTLKLTLLAVKDIIIRGGENVDSVAVENALYNDPRVLQAACVGVPDARLGELVTAVVHVRAGQGVTDAALLARCRTRYVWASGG